jgi:hypothetical protein
LGIVNSQIDLTKADRFCHNSKKPNLKINQRIGGIHERCYRWQYDSLP